MTKVRPRGKLRIFRFHYAPNKQLFHFAVLIKDDPGSLGDVLHLLSSHVNLIGINTYSNGDGTAIFSGFAESLSPSLKAAQLEGIVAKSPRVLEANISEGVDGLVVDKYHTGLQTGFGDPYVAMPAESLSKMFGHIIEVFGTGGHTLLYQEGLSFGTDRGHTYRRALGSKPSPEMREQIASIFPALGYGVAAFVKPKAGEVQRITLADCFECTSRREARQGCSFMRGVLTGFFSVWLDVPLEGDEVKCRFNGDGVCEFVLKPAKAS